jgi:hypothetical protein
MSDDLFDFFVGAGWVAAFVILLFLNILVRA